MNDCQFSFVFPIPTKTVYTTDKLEKMFFSVLSQNIPPHHIFLLDGSRDTTLGDRLFQLAAKKNISCEIIPAQNQFLSAFAYALSKMQTTHFIFIDNEKSPIYFSKSASDLYRWTCLRNPQTGLFYSDYDRINPDGSRVEVHLLPFHKGRIRDNMDFGNVFVCNTAMAREVGGFSSTFPHGYLYDFRLKIATNHTLLLISNRYQGAPYCVEELGKGHNVFDYLLSDKEIQLEMEQIVTDHLKRIGAYIPPGNYKQEITYSAEEEKQFEECIASVIIPVNNRPQFIGAAIESVLRQTVKQVEVIVVVNGGENDATIDEVKKYLEGGEKFNPALPSVRLLVHDINNIGLCLNSGLKMARGKFYVQLDSDDRLKADAVEKLLQVYESDPHIGMVIGSYEVWQLEEDGKFFRREDIPVVTHDEWTEENGRNNLMRINGAGAPRSAHLKVLAEMGWFSVNDIPYSRNYGEDYEMVLKISEKYRIGRVWQPIYEVVRHSGGTDHSIDQHTIDRNDNAKDEMRLEAILRRQKLNLEKT